VTPNSVGSSVLEHLFDLDSGQLHTLDLVVAILAKQPRH
jgi:hypothetical protein